MYRVYTGANEANSIDTWYWRSSEFDYGNAYLHVFHYDYQYSEKKFHSKVVRVDRVFNYLITIRQ